MTVRINERLNVNGELCTVRYVGSISEWPDEIAYGVEWDRDIRGKHDGSLNGKRYFLTTDGKASGSFLKEAKVLQSAHTRQSFEEALFSQYNSETSTKDLRVKFGSKQSIAYGFEHLNEINSNVESLESISLAKNNIAIARGYHLNHEHTILSRTPQISLRYLDLSFNLFDDINEVYRILHLFPNLRSLVLSGNCFAKYSNDCKCDVQFPSVRELSLACCKLQDENVEHLFASFPSLETLDLSSNMLTVLPDIPFKIKMLNVSDNRFTNFPSHSLESSCVSALDLSGNQIETIKNLRPNMKMTSLRLDRNLITDWKEVDSINTVFPQLSTLWLKSNPICRENTQEDFYSIIARLSFIEVLDGSAIDKTLRREAELFFISSVLSSRILYDRESKEWLRLVKNYDVNITHSTLHEQPSFLSSEIVKVPVWYESKFLEMTVLRSFSVRYFKTLLKHRLGLTGELKVQYSILKDVRHEFSYEYSPLATYNISESTVYVV